MDVYDTEINYCVGARDGVTFDFLSRGRISLQKVHSLSLSSFSFI